MKDDEFRTAIKVLYCHTPFTVLAITDLFNGQISRKTITRWKLKENWIKTVPKKLDDPIEIETKEEFNLQQIEKKVIKEALEKTNWNRRKAAVLLGINERTLYRKIKEFS